MSIQDEARAEALADFIATERDKYPRRADDMDSEELAQKIIEWLASRKPEAAPATPVSDTDREALREELEQLLYPWLELDGRANAADTILTWMNSRTPQPSAVDAIGAQIHARAIEALLTALGVTDDYLSPDIEACGCDAEEGTLHLIWHLEQRASQPVQVEVTDDMIARAEREYQWSGNIRKVLVAALGGGE